MTGEPQHADRTRAEVFVGEDGDWYSRVFDANGHELFRSSEGYENRTDCVAVIQSRFGPIPIEYEDGEA